MKHEETKSALADLGSNSDVNRRQYHHHPPQHRRPRKMPLPAVAPTTPLLVLPPHHLTKQT